MKTIRLTKTEWAGLSTADNEQVLTGKAAMPMIPPIVCFLAGHQWHGCTCSRCDKVRDAEHLWVPVKTEPGKSKCAHCGLPLAVHGLEEEPVGGQAVAVPLTQPPRPLVYAGRRFFSNPSDPYATSWTAHGG